MVKKPDPSTVFSAESTRQSYSTVVVSLSAIRVYLFTEFPNACASLRIPASEFEYLYDWMIAEAVDKVLSLRSARVESHYRNDLYKCVYDLLGHYVEYAITQQIASHNLNFLSKETVKLMVAGDALFIARGVNLK